MKPTTAFILLALFSGLLWVYYEFAYAPQAELEKALADAAAGDVTQKIHAADMYMICDNVYRMNAKVLVRESWSEIRTYGFLMRCSSKTVQAGGKLLEEAALSGSAEACYRMGLATLFAKDNSSFAWMKKAAEKDHKLAQLALASRYLSGKPPQNAEGFFWLEVSGLGTSSPWQKQRYDSARNALTDAEKASVMKRVDEWRKKHRGGETE